MYHLLYAVQSFLYTIVGNNRGKEVSYFIIALHQNVFVVEPDAFLIVETGTCLAALGNVKLLHQFVQTEQFLLRAGVPSQQSEEIDDRLGEIALFTKSA